MSFRPFISSAFAIVGCLGSVMAQQKPASDWPQWRGPNGDGVSRESGWVEAYKAGTKELWRVKVGNGFSSPAIRNGKLSSEPRNPQAEFVQCLDTNTGKELWKHPYKIASVQRGQNPSGEPRPSSAISFSATAPR